MKNLLVWMESTSLAVRVSESVMLTAGLSAVHVLGFTIIMGGALLSNLRLAGVLFRDRSLVEVVLPATRGVAVGLMLSLPTGALLFAPRAIAAAGNGTFRLKMLFLLAGAALQFLLVGPAVRGRHSEPRLRLIGGAGLAAWLALALAACAFILLE